MHAFYNSRWARSAPLLLVVVAVLGLEACGQTEAAPPEIPRDTVMQTVRAYGRGHQGTPAPAPSGLPDTTLATYVDHVHNLLDQGNYAELENLAQINRSERGRFVAGDWRNNFFFNAVVWVSPTPPPKDSDYQYQLEKLKKWQAARPDSAAAKIAFAKFYVQYADFARGTGYANSVSGRQWRQYHARTALAKQALLEAAALKERDPHWYLVMQDIAHNEGWEKADARELLDQALAFEPDYFHFYRLYSIYLLPQWYGDHGEIPAFAKQVASKHPEPAGSILYFQIVSTLACYCEGEIEELKTNADWQQLQLGFANLQADYGLSDLNANRFAEMATVFGDKPVAREAFSHVVQRNTAVWLTEDSFQQSRTWANSSGNQ
jgi:Domain of unknown function (DUF4034)